MKSGQPKQADTLAPTGGAGDHDTTIYCELDTVKIIDFTDKHMGFYYN